MQKHVLHLIIFLFSNSLVFSQTRIAEGSHSYAFVLVHLGNMIPADYDSVCIKLSLPKVDSSPDSFMLRLWTSSMMGYGVITLRKINDKWEAHQYTYLAPPTLYEKSLRPKASIDLLMESLKKIDFASLKNQSQIPGFKDRVDDGVTYTLEVIYKDHPNIFSYHSPNTYTDPDNQKFVAVLKLLNNYFKIDN